MNKAFWGVMEVVCGMYRRLVVVLSSRRLRSLSSVGRPGRPVCGRKKKKGWKKVHILDQSRVVKKNLKSKI